MRTTMKKRSDLSNHGLRLPFRARHRLNVLAAELRVFGYSVSAGSAVRGLCLLALNVLDGGAGHDTARALRIPAVDPTWSGVYRGLRALRSLLDLDEGEPSTVRVVSARKAARGVRPRYREPLQTQALRLPSYAHARIEAVADELHAAGALATTHGVVRGLCLIAVQIADGAAGDELAAAFRCAASNPTEEGVRHAMELIRSVLDHEAPTVRNSLDFLDEERSPANDAPPPTFPSARVATLAG